MKARLLLVGRIALFLAGAFISGKQVNEYWYIGPTFGIVVLAWYANSIQQLLSLRSLGFLVASTLIYALVARLAGELMVAVAIGTLLLPTAHAALLGTSWRRTAIAVPGIYGTWYLLGLLTSWLGERWRLGPLEHFVHLVSIWQVAYLLFMFVPSPRIRGKP